MVPSTLALPPCSQIPDAGFGNDGASGVAVLAPAGTYRISRMLEIVQSNVVLRGEGVGKTTLFFPKGLKAVYGEGAGRRGRRGGAMAAGGLDRQLPCPLLSCDPLLDNQASCCRLRSAAAGPIMQWEFAGGYLK